MSVKSKGRQVVLIASIVLMILALNVSCQDDESTIGFASAQERLRTVMVDTFTVNASTVILDSIYTSGSDRILVGRSADAYFGLITGASYFQIAPGRSAWNVDDDAQYDSIALILVHDGFYEGDTIPNQQLIVEQLTEELKGRSFYNNIFKDIPYSYFYTGSGLYNTSTISVSASSLGSHQYRPQPLSKDSIVIRLDDALGESWFEWVQENNSVVTDNDLFLENFRGVRVRSLTSGLFLGYKASEAKVRVYYHVASNSGYTEERFVDFPLHDNTLQYNSFEANRAGTSLASLTNGAAIGSRLTNNETYVQGGVGMVTKLEFPHVQLINEQKERITVMHAELVISALRNGWDDEELPSSLQLYYADDLDTPAFMSSDNDAQDANRAVLQADEEYNREYTCRFQLRNYISALIKDEDVPSKSLFVALPSADFLSTAGRVRLGSPQHADYPMKLLVYYTKVQSTQ